MFMKFLIPSIVAGAVLAGSAAIAADKTVDVSKLPPPADKKGVSYAADIKLRLDSLEAALKGSENGKVIEPGNSAKSVMVHNIGRIGDEDDWMPPVDKGDPLSKDQVALIRAWIDQGAK